MAGDSFLICFRQFYFLTLSEDFAKAIAFAWRPFFPIFKMVSLFLTLGGHKYTLRHGFYLFGYLEFFMKNGHFFYIPALECFKNFRNATFASFRTSDFSIAFSFFFEA